MSLAYNKEIFITYIGVFLYMNVSVNFNENNVHIERYRWIPKTMPVF